MADNINTSVDLMRVPLNPNGLFTLGFQNNTARETYFNGKIYQSISNCVFIRKDNIIRCGVNADVIDAAGVNYVRYINPNYGHYFYAFVREIRYIAPQTTELVIETDSFITYQSKITATYAYVERRHASATEDAAYNTFEDGGTNEVSVIPEPVSINLYNKKEAESYFMNTSDASHFDASFYVGVITGSFNISPDDGTNHDPNAQAKDIMNRQCSHYYGGIPIGGNLYCVSHTDLNDFAACVGTLGGEIICAFPVKSATLNNFSITYTRPDGVSKTFTGYYPTNTDTGYNVTNTIIPLSTDVEKWGFNPHNKKLHTYPYNFLVGDDGMGSETVYRIELFSGKIPKFDIGYLSAPSPAVVAIPTNYQISEAYLGNAVINNSIPQIPYQTNAYAQYIGVHANELMFTKAANYIEFATGFIPSTTTNESTGSQTIRTGNPLTMGIDAGLKEEQINAQMSDLKGIGNSVHNVPSGCLQGCNGALGVIIYEKYISTEEARRIDSFFDRYGYAWCKTEQLNFYRCSNYNYIKTSGANVQGNIPMKDKAKINALLDSGITIWNNTANYGNYSAGANG